MSEAKFTVKYTGPALDDGTMDVRDLAPALLAVGDSCTRANQILNGSAARVKINVNAGFEEGSFGIDLIMSQVINNKETMDFVANANQILQLAGYAVHATGVIALGAFAVIKKLKGNRPEEVTEGSDGTVNVTYNGCTFVSTKQALAMASDDKFVEHAQKAVSPVRQTGIDSVVFGNENNPDNTITKDHLDSFVIPDPKEEPPVVESTHDTFYEVVTPSLQGDYKWRLGAEGGTIMAKIEDEAFIEEVVAGKHAFRCGDILKVKIRIKAWRNSNGNLSREYTILQVIEHVERPEPTLPEFPRLGNPDATS